MNMKDQGDQTILDIKNFTKILLSNILKKEKYAINKIEMKDNSRYVNTVALNIIAKSFSLNVRRFNLEKFHHNYHYSHNISNTSGNTQTVDQCQELT